LWFLGISLDIIVFDCFGGSAEVVKLRATADIWLSDANAQERNSSSGIYPRLKLKSIQEMAAIRFDTSPIRGRQIVSARLFLHPLQSKNQLRYIRISTINQDWVEGGSRKAYGSGNGATYNYADYMSKKPWAWPGSQFCDVTFSSGRSLSCWAERREEKGGWISVEVDPNIVIAMTVGDSDGMAVMDGGTLRPFDNYIHSRESGPYTPYLMVTVGSPVRMVPGLPIITVTPDQDHATAQDGAIRIQIKNDPTAFCWKVKVNGRKLFRWEVPHPGKKEGVEFSVSDLPSGKPVDIEVWAISASGDAGRIAETKGMASSAWNAGISLDKILPPCGKNEAKETGPVMDVWAFPALVKLSPLDARPLHQDIGWDKSIRKANAVWNGKQVRLFGIRGEYVDLQICIQALKGKPVYFEISPEPLHGPHDAVLKVSDIEIYKNWYAKTKTGIWQPAYTVPVKPGAVFSIPDPERGIPNQQNQTFTVDVYIPKDAEVGVYTGDIKVITSGQTVRLPVQIGVHGAHMPDKLAFWPELNAYHIPENYIAYYRLAYKNRCVANFWAFRPRIIQEGGKIWVDWDEYDKRVEPLLSGQAFADDHRNGIPLECMYLPFMDSWPTALSEETYAYSGYWPQKGESLDYLIVNSLEAPFIADALSQRYKANFLSVQKQFVEHFKGKGWQETELQCFFGGKKTHRINYGSNIWWTTDEPSHWEDWTALRFFTGLWSRGVGRLGALNNIWAARADISRPQWQGKVLQDCVDVVYYGGFNNDRTYHRCRILKEETGVQVRAYGSASPHDRSNIETIPIILNAWLNGADGFLTWWSTGREGSLDVQEGCPGNALLAPGHRFNLAVVGDMRLKAFRDGEQMIEYLVLLGKKHGLNRRHLKYLVLDAISPKSGPKEGGYYQGSGDFLKAFSKAWQIQALRMRILEMLGMELGAQTSQCVVSNR